MKVCYFGIYDPNYPRNEILISGLRENGVEVIECNTRAKGIKKYFDLYFKHRKIKHDYDFMVVGFLGQGIMPWAKFLSRKRIIFDAFLSLYNTNVFDRKRYSPTSLRGRYDFFLDQFSCRLANLVLLDTNAHIDYFVETFKLPRHKFKRIFVGANNHLFYPAIPKEKKASFLVHFHGYLVPFHGIEYVIEAARILKDDDITWQIVTRFDSLYRKTKDLVDSLGLIKINFFEVVPFAELKNYINRADVCLGVFGDSKKRELVIPNKIYEALACQKPVITAESKACRETLTDGANYFYVRPADAKDLANKILELKNNPGLLKQVAFNGYKLYQENLTPKILIQRLLTDLKNEHF